MPQVSTLCFCMFWFCLSECNIHPYSCKFPHQTQNVPSCTVNLVIADGHFNLPSRVSMGMYRLACTNQPHGKEGIKDWDVFHKAVSEVFSLHKHMGKNLLNSSVKCIPDLQGKYMIPLCCLQIHWSIARRSCSMGRETEGSRRGAGDMAGSAGPVALSGGCLQ